MPDTTGRLGFIKNRYYCPNCLSRCSVEVDKMFISPSHTPCYNAHMQCRCGYFAGAYADTKEEAEDSMRRVLVDTCENALDPEYADASGEWKCSWCGHVESNSPRFCPGCGHCNIDYR